MKHLQENLVIPACKLHAFTDSTVILYWIHWGRQRFEAFEANWIGEIHEHVLPEEWKHIDGEENPVDAGSCGILPGEIPNHKLCWNGPKWIKEAPSGSKFTPPPSLESLCSPGVKKETLQLTLQAVTTEVKPVIDI